ncbi:RNA polymerase sigma factor RpoD/SigA [Venenivibrio stagnispumantis]|uniref:RNA polymerase primary sigma factor n=1 Tax=Venenivibrio stagnispumantis TaxID=407998 RepID=A0AA46ADG3_9AQUI|nr:RNA polymerase sigma factor RpoD/SigA [Venenivibrio stagnispumantis]MCW4572953.1 RNA polymerase sigma factor RpoD/SigA [Venenivibrio stagnispumantis]SMP05095.1 RNA polymerase primary sigma factor [Venenivibrio stagnispumantis]
MEGQDKEQTTLNLYIQQMAKHPLLTPEEEKELAIRAKKGDKEALKKLVEGNLRFVINIAKNFMGWGVPLVDLIAAGNLGLIEAAKRFDPDKNVKFISYAVWWIRQAIMQTIFQQTGAVRIPIKESLFISKVKETYDRLKEQLEREPTIEELAKELKVSPRKIKNALAVVRMPVSLDMPIGEEGEEMTLLDVLSKSGTEDIEKELIEESLHKDLESLLNALDERERKIIELRYGLTGEEPKTLTEVGDEIGISRERVRQLEQRALKKLKNLAMKKHLKDFLS